MKIPSIIRIWLGLLAVCFVSGCSHPTANPIEPTAITATDTPISPTETSVPLAAQINGEAIPLSTYQSEVARYERAQNELGTDLAMLGDYKEQVLQALIDRKLMAQAAIEMGYSVEPNELDRRVEELAQTRGGDEALQTWLSEQGYSWEGFRQSLVDSILVAYMVDSIAQGVPETAEQVHARHIMVPDLGEAEELYAQLLDGTDFAELAQAYSIDLSTRPAGGDLGWFPRGVLLVPEVESQAFTLPLGEISAPVESSFGYHIVETLERGERLLTPDALQQLRRKAIEDWLTTQRETAEITIFVEP